MNPTPLRLLLAEDAYADASLVLAALKREGYELETIRVMSSADFRVALAAHDFHVILCDYAMPGFTALDALEILDASGKDIPLIIVSGAIGEDLAVAVMRGGAMDRVGHRQLSARNQSCGQNHRHQRNFSVPCVDVIARAGRDSFPRHALQRSVVAGIPAKGATSGEVMQVWFALPLRTSEVTSEP